MKPFMVSQLQIAFERENLILSPYDELLYKQLIDYEVDKIGANGNPTFTSKNEHFIDALGLAYLAMVLEFKDLTGVVQDLETTSNFSISKKNLIRQDSGSARTRMDNVPQEIKDFYENTDFREVPGERQQWVKTNFSEYRDNSYSNYRSSTSSWCSRSSGLNNFSR